MRDKPIFVRFIWGASSGPSDAAGQALTYRQFMFNLTYHRHVAETVIFLMLLLEKIECTMLNCILDFNNSE